MDRDKAILTQGRQDAGMLADQYPGLVPEKFERSRPGHVLLLVQRIRCQGIGSLCVRKSKGRPGVDGPCVWRARGGGLRAGCLLFVVGCQGLPASNSPPEGCRRLSVAGCSLSGPDNQYPTNRRAYGGGRRAGCWLLVVGCRRFQVTEHPPRPRQGGCRLPVDSCRGLTTSIRQQTTGRRRLRPATSKQGVCDFVSCRLHVVKPQACPRAGDFTSCVPRYFPSRNWNAGKPAVICGCSSLVNCYRYCPRMKNIAWGTK